MGYVRWDASSWDKYSTVTSARTEKENFTSKSLNPDMDPKDVIRESRDSDLNPESTPIMVGCDVTGSMGMISNKLVSEGLGTLFTEILDRKPVTDPHLLVGGIGDVLAYDRAPLQVSQFEADLTIAKQLEKIYVEHGGGSNNTESYDMFVYFAAFNTTTDCVEKRGKRGYLFTIGDEEPVENISAAKVKDVIGGGLQADMPFSELVDIVSKSYNYYHIIIKEGSHMRYRPDQTKDKWVNLLGQNAIVLDDYNDLAEVIVSIIEINEGKDAETVAASWDGSTSLVIANATKHLTAGGVAADSDTIRL